MNQIKGMLKKLLPLLLILSTILAISACGFDDWDDWDDTPDSSSNTTSGVEYAESIPVSFNEAQSSFVAHDPRVKMIEVNQSLSYGFDTDTGELFLMDHFAAGKETAIFVSFNESLKSVFGSGEPYGFLNVYRDDILLDSIPSAGTADFDSLYFQPRNMADVGYWEEGAYKFEVYLGNNEEAAATRTTNFYRSGTMKILAVPVVTNYGGRIARPSGEWQQGGTMVAATFPIARADVEYILGAELDLSHIDITTDEGQYDVWEALSNQQTRGQDYDVIVGFVPNAIEIPGWGAMLGYTFGQPAVIATEDDPEMMATVIHEIAHVYKIGDEYEGGALNPKINSPPYGMSGWYINNQNRTVYGEKRAVRGGNDIGLEGVGSVIYNEQRPFFVEGRTPLYNTTSYMGSGTGADSFEMWVTSDKWIHKFRTFTGQRGGGILSGDFVPGSSVSGGSPSGGGSGGSAPDSYNYCEDDGWFDSYLGQCSSCYMFILDDPEPDYYIECNYTYGVFTELKMEHFDNGFYCWFCEQMEIVVYEDVYIECPSCEHLERFMCFDVRSCQFRASSPTVANANFRTAAPSQFMVVEISGFVTNRDEFVASPWYVFEADASDVDNNREGDYSAHFYDASGKLISIGYFDVDFNAMFRTTEGTKFIPWERASVNTWLRFPEQTARISIQKGDKEIYSTTLSKTAPTVAFTGLNDYDMLDNRVTLTWEASGEKDELFFEIWYIPAEDEFYNIASNVTGRSLTVDLSGYPGTNEGYFYIYVTDGVRTGEVDSPWIKVPFKAPEFIGTQQGTTSVKITEEIYFDAEIYDLQDGWLWLDDEVVWTLNGREFMSGSALWVWPYELAPGIHTFTATATNSAGMSSSRNYSFTILDDELDLPNDWSREYIKDALTNGFSLPLNRIDTPVTRRQFATLMTLMFEYMLEYDYDYPDYIEGIVTDSGQDDYDQFLMVHLGLMKAPGGRFEPNRPITEQEAALLMYRVSALADPDWFGSDESDNDILEFYLEYGIIDTSGNNALNENQNLTNRLALVRISKFFEAVFGE